MQAVRQNMQLGVLPRDEGAVHPDVTVALVERQNRHGKILARRP